MTDRFMKVMKNVLEDEEITPIGTASKPKKTLMMKVLKRVKITSLMHYDLMKLVSEWRDFLKSKLS
jgi:hypothetical protein